MWRPTEITGTLGNGLSSVLDLGHVANAQIEGTLTNRELKKTKQQILADHKEYVTNMVLKILVALDKLISLPPIFL